MRSPTNNMKKGGTYRGETEAERTYGVSKFVQNTTQIKTTTSDEKREKSGCQECSGSGGSPRRKLER